MHSNTNAAHETASVLHEPDSEDLELVRLPNGTHAWLRPERARRFILPSRYWITDRGRRALAAAALFDKGPTVAKASRP